MPAATTSSEGSLKALTTARLDLEPLIVAHAEAMFEVLSDETVHRYIDSKPPPSVEHVRNVYARLEARHSPDGTQRWLNWIVVPHRRTPIGFVQATIMQPGTAWIAYLVASGEAGKGYAIEAVVAMLAHLADDWAIGRYLATVEADHRRSIALLERVGFRLARRGECEGHDLAASERLFVRP